jgi:hypothetical protein
MENRPFVNQLLLKALSLDLSVDANRTPHSLPASYTLQGINAIYTW